MSEGADVLRCTICRREEPVGDVAARDRDGWPKCCGETMFLGVRTFARPTFDPRNA